jgi:hypothetical protein
MLLDIKKILGSRTRNENSRKRREKVIPSKNLVAFINALNLKSRKEI